MFISIYLKLADFRLNLYMKSLSLKEMRREAEILQRSSEWLTDQLDELIIRVEDPYMTNEDITALQPQIDQFLLRSQWENNEFKKFYKKYERSDDED
tara:strand:+ start:336 stop:626 length:291 start_codon:yes stop_codon:yes gene_type:complete